MTSWAAGRVPNPCPRAVHFAVSALIDAEIRNGECSRVILRAGNVYASTRVSDRWPDDFVKVTGTGDTAPTLD